jgi:hypothetical protein
MKIHSKLVGLVIASLLPVGVLAALPAGAAGTLPTVTSVSPGFGPIAGGTPVTISGANLTGATAVKFNGTPATSVNVVSATTITATSPALAANFVGNTVDVTVTNSAGTSAASVGDGFTYTYNNTTPLNPLTR